MAPNSGGAAPPSQVSPTVTIISGRATSALSTTTVTTQGDYIARGLLVKNGIHDCRPLTTPGYGQELALMQP